MLPSTPSASSVREKVLPLPLLPPEESRSCLTYNEEVVPWRLRLRKEVFAPAEQDDHLVTVALCFHQILADVAIKNHPRIADEERSAMQELLKQRNLSSATAKNADVADTTDVVARARKWPGYFVRNFPVALAGNEDPHTVAVGHAGVSINRVERRLVAQTGQWQTNIRPVVSQAYADVDLRKWTVSTPERLTVQHLDSALEFECGSARSIMQMIDAYLMDLSKDAKYVLTVRAYDVRDATLLSFPEDVVVTLGSRDSEPGWLYGTYDGRTGAFPVDYVVPIIGAPTESAVDKARAAAASGVRGAGAEYGAGAGGAGGKVGSGAGGAGGAGDRRRRRPKRALQALTSKMGAEPGFTVRTRYGPITDERLPQGKYSMLEYAKENFRMGAELYRMQRTGDGSVRGTVLKVGTRKGNRRNKAGGGTSRAGAATATVSWSWGELVTLVKWTASPIQVSLTDLDKALPEAAPAEISALNKVALDSFLDIMRFMGDYMAGKRTEMDVVRTLVHAGHRRRKVRERVYKFESVGEAEAVVMRNEIYCQMIKQLTNNRSARPESAARCWRLMVILSAYFAPSDAFEPYVRSYLQATAYTEERDFKDQAFLCLRNLQATRQNGGREELCAAAELDAILDGRYWLLQKFFLPSGDKWLLKVAAITTMADVVKEICGKMGVEAQAAEYGLYLHTDEENTGVLQSGGQYVFDVVNVLQRKNVPFRLYFRRVLYFSPNRYSNELFTEAMFTAVSGDVNIGYHWCLSALDDETLEQMVSPLLVLQHLAQHPVPALETLLPYYRKLLPKSVSTMATEGDWAGWLSKSITANLKISASEARKRYLMLATKLPLFGCRFFHLSRVFDPRISGAAILAISKDHIRFLDPATREVILHYAYSEVVSIRRMGSRGTNQHYIDLKLGNLMVQRVTRCETRQGIEISAIIGAYIAGDPKSLAIKRR